MSPKALHFILPFPAESFKGRDNGGNEVGLVSLGGDTKAVDNTRDAMTNDY